MELVSPEPRSFAGARQAGFYAPTSVWNVTNTETMRSGHRAAVPNTRIRAPSQIFDLAYKMSYTSHECAVRNLLFLWAAPRKNVTAWRFLTSRLVACEAMKMRRLSRSETCDAGEKFCYTCYFQTSSPTLASHEIVLVTSAVEAVLSTSG